MSFRSFHSEKGVSEHFFSLEGIPGKSFPEELSKLLDRYTEELHETGCSEGTEFLLRFHLSDITNQAPFLRKTLAERKTFLSCIGQPPASGAHIALEAWHITSCLRTAGKSLISIQFHDYQAQLFHQDQTFSGSFQQTEAEFEALKTVLSGMNGTVEADTQRTWLYCRDVDNHYQGLVAARNKFFAENGLTKETHFIASTGIEGTSEDPHRLVMMDSLNWFGLKREQIQYLYAEDHLSPTALYGVSFERGTRLLFGDRSHVYISGTASIDSRGKVLHECDVLGQTERMVENISALLQEGETTLDAIRLATVYLRDPADAPAVRKRLAELLPEGLPYVLLKAPVCRPAWLIETECIAVTAETHRDFPPLRGI